MGIDGHDLTPAQPKEHDTVCDFASDAFELQQFFPHELQPLVVGLFSSTFRSRSVSPKRLQVLDRCRLLIAARLDQMSRRRRDVIRSIPEPETSQESLCRSDVGEEFRSWERVQGKVVRRRCWRWQLGRHEIALAFVDVVGVEMGRMREAVPELGTHAVHHEGDSSDVVVRRTDEPVQTSPSERGRGWEVQQKKLTRREFPTRLA